MAGYFNKTRGPVTVSLKNGESAIVGPKKTMIVTPEQDGSASLHAMVRRGLLIRLKEKPPKPVPAPAPEPISAPATAPESLPSAEPMEVPSEEPSMEWTKGRLTVHAEFMGLEVPSSWTKVEILEAIEEAD